MTSNLLAAFLPDMHVEQRANERKVRKVYLVSKRSGEIKKILCRIEEAKDRRIYENDNFMWT